MVAKIKFSRSIRRALNYNEQKLQRGQATLIHAANYIQEPDEMNFYQKLERFEKQMALNERAKTNTLHISLNFDPSDKLDVEKLKTITNDYMQQLGFGNQPYLVYQHTDAGHPHLHVVTTNIMDDGKRIYSHNLGRDVSEPARQALELKYGLTIAKGRELKQEQALKKEYLHKVEYGKAETKRSITNVLDYVIGQYKYTSLPELNAVLQQYNVIADRGEESGRIYKNRGLTYRILDENGRKMGVPIKASSIYSRPTLDKLEQKFNENKLKRQPDVRRLKTTIDFTLLKKPPSLNELLKALEKERISVVVRRSREGKIYGMTYIDHQTRSVFNGSDLGKEYAAKRMLERLGLNESKSPQKELKQEQQQNKLRIKESAHSPETAKEISPIDNFFKGLSKTLEQVMQPEETGEQLAYELKEEQKRRKKKREHSHEP